MTANHDVLDPATRDFYRAGMQILNEANIPFLVGGAYALAPYTGIVRHTKDFDIFVRPVDASRVLALFVAHGYQSEMTFPHWLGKVYAGDYFIDIIFSSGNGLATVDDEWFSHATAGQALGLPVGLCPAEEIIWQKAFVAERERYDGADIAHLLRARAADLDWPRLLRRFGPHWRLLFAHLVLFGFIYPEERERIPPLVMADLLGRLHAELDTPAPGIRVCQGTLLSRQQFLTDVKEWGFEDARLLPHGKMGVADVARWTDAIDKEEKVPAPAAVSSQ